MKSHAKLHWSRVLVAVVCLALLGLAQDKPGSVSAAAAQAEEADLRAVVEKFYAAYGKKDLAGVMALWSEKSPDLAAYKKTLEQQFPTEDYSFGSPTISRLKIEGEKASLRATVDFTAINLQSKQSRKERMVRNFRFVKEGGEWKLWRYVSATDGLAETLVQAQTETEKAALLAEEKALVTLELVRALITQGRRFYGQGRYPQALAVYGLAQSIGEQIDDKAGIANVLGNIGIVHYSQGNSAQALEYHQKSLALSETLGDKAVIARTLGNIGNAHNSQGNYAQALEYYQKCLVLSESLGDKAVIASALHSIGNVHNSQGNYTQALEYHQKSLALSEALGNKAGIASTLTNIGNTHRSQGNYAQALEYHQKSLALSESLGNKAVIASTLGNIGNVHISRGNYMQALEYYLKSLALNEALGNKAGIANTLNSIGSVHGSQGNYAQALEYYQKSLVLKESLGNKAVIAGTLTNIGNVHNSQGNYAQALEYYQKSLALSEALGAKEDIASTLNNIGSTHISQGNYAQALEYYQKCLVLSESLGDKAVIASTLVGMGIAHNKQGRFTQARDLAQRAATLARQVGRSELLWESYLAAGTAYRALNQSAQARQAYTDAINTIETIRTQVAGGAQGMQGFFESKLSPYQAMVDLLLTENNLVEALTYAERAKARALLDVMHNGRVNITKAMTEKERERERALNNQLISLNTQIFRESQREKPDKTRIEALEKDLQKTRLEYEAFETNLYAAHPELKVRRGEAEILTLEEARTLLPDIGTAALKFVVAEEKTSLFVLTKSAPGSQAAVEVKVFPIAIKQKDLEERVKQFRDQVAARDQAFAKNAAAMFQLLLAPARPLLQGKTTLIIVPDGPLWELPFQALQSPENRYLLQDHAVFYAPSLTVLREMVKLRRQNRAPAATSTLLAVGNPALGQQTVKLVQDATMGEKLGPLPAAHRQAEELGKLYGQQRSKVYTGADATEERVKTESANYNILHLAAHGALNNRSPMYSHIVLSQMDENGKEDGLLEAWELMKLDLKADLAVLSACETARGRVVGGEGVIGLTWALFVAGCPTTVVSQWKVNDRSTADLMVEFHKQLKTRSASLDSRNSIAQALRQAALKLLDKSQYRHPYYWAGFIVVGDGY